MFPTSTPWGPSQSQTEYAPGIVFYSTAEHGGFHLSPARLKALPRRLHKRNRAYCPLDWFEEDCEAALVIAGFPAVFSAAQVQAAERTIAQYYPEKIQEGSHADA